MAWLRLQQLTASAASHGSKPRLGILERWLTAGYQPWCEEINWGESGLSSPPSKNGSN